ncbi:KpsF/GutQ family sugar-phosphate isomerase [Motiliproteus coralliicola]|uniref:Arabinose 5-phosphate isomerase n=1 Tax=Motiliproteus coralliicola TaxID=2283196 RepID=A0A369WRS0_9GAMM|nr:KpsF/GutQ family sugar-phosphate isomerase [Motiliproteus coralliicola]RDE24818.1 KpsF/GutQ family sugar-phosphate isomerase [Motiliproteus coralliicola]
MKTTDHSQQAFRVFEIEAQAILNLKHALDGHFNQAVEAIINSSGKAVVCGIGKSGIIGEKISATLSSTGTASFFMHPSEAIHGDLGRISSNDCFIMISNSGETEEVIRLLPFMLDNGNTIIALTGNPSSTLAKNASVHLNIGVEEEACPLKLAPTSSTTATLAMGDALAVALMVARDFQPEQFARFHPGGNLGRKLLTQVKDVIRDAPLPLIGADERMDQIISTITAGRVGLVIVGDIDKVQGVISDGDIRRAMQAHPHDFLNIQARTILTQNPKSIASSASVQDAIEMMNQHNITALIVTDENGKVVGVVQLFDCNL